MNYQLTEEICYHILANLGVLPSTFVSVQSSRSIIDKQFIIPDKINFQIEDQSVSKNVYGAQVMITGDKEFKLLLVDNSLDDVPEYGLLVQMKDAPAFGVYLVFNKLLPPDQQIEAQAMIAVMSEDHWIPCSIYLQATFLAGMEQLRDLCVNWGQVKSYDQQYQNLISFLDFHSNFYGGQDEG